MKSFKKFLDEGRYVYHTTFTKNVRAIKSKGLVPLQTSNWVKTGSPKVRYNEDGGIFAFADPEDAWKWAFKQEFEFNKPVSIIRMKKTKQWTKDPSQDIGLTMGKGDALKSIEMVKPSDIKDTFQMKDFSNPSKLGISQKEWIKGIVKKLK